MHSKKLCRDCKSWESEWYDDEYQEWRGYGCHQLAERGRVNVGICLLAPKDSHVRLEDVKACDKFERKDTAGEDVENLLFGEDNG